jgi:DNA-binding LytR/AlgR family response regulator
MLQRKKHRLLTERKARGCGHCAGPRWLCPNRVTCLAMSSAPPVAPFAVAPLLELPPLRCVIVDDELLPRLAVEKELRRYPELQCVGRYASLAELRAAELPAPPDVLFLDIELGANEDGLAYYKGLPAPPLAVFITSHAEYALDSIEAAAFDYILKPLTAERFDRVVARLLEHQALHHKAALYELHVGGEFLNIREGYEVSRVPMQDIVYLEALDNYTKIHTPRRRYLTLVSLKTLCEQLPPRRFLRIHRTFAVAVAKINRLVGGEVVVGGTVLPVGRTYRPQVQAFLQGA